MPVKLALSTLCENPDRRTGLSTLFPEMVRHARRAFPEVHWIVFAGRRSPWPDDDPAVELCRDFPSNESPVGRLLSDHLLVAAEARRRGASALLTVGFNPLRPAGLPVAMQVVAPMPGPGDGVLRGAYRAWALRRGLARSALVIANSSWTAAQLGARRGPLITSPEGVQHDRFSPDGPRGGRGLPSTYLLWVSNLYPYKRFDLALRAYAALPDALRRDYPLVVVGGDWAGGRRRAETLAESLGVRASVIFTGWVPDGDLPAVYRGAHALVLSTSQETFGRYALEAMACGCPCVLQDLPVLREVAGECALYADFRDTPSASALLQSVCSGGWGRDQLALAGIERSRAYGFERLARERVTAVLSAAGKALG